ncbi:hypothetical protein D9M72_570810 [compost metagenome]
MVSMRMACSGVPLKFSKTNRRLPQSVRNRSRITRPIFTRSCGLPTGPLFMRSNQPFRVLSFHWSSLAKISALRPERSTSS